MARPFKPTLSRKKITSDEQVQMCCIIKWQSLQEEHSAESYKYGMKQQ